MTHLFTIANPVTDLQFTTLDTNTASTETILTAAKVAVTASEFKSRNTVSTIKNSQIIDVDTLLVKANPKSVPSTLDVAAYQADLVHVNKLKALEARLRSQANEIKILVQLEMSNIMAKNNAILENARIVAKTDKGVAEAMDTLDLKYFTHAAAATSTEFTIAMAGLITPGHINPEKPFVNTNKTILSILNVGGKESDRIKVNPFTGAVLPKTWKAIVVTNLSPTDEGTFEVHLG